MTTSVETYRKQFQKKRTVKVKSLTEYINAIAALDSRRMLYRGQSNESWEIQSSAYRHLTETTGETPTINTLLKYHEKLIRDLHNLNDCEKLEGAEMLAELQHKGANTWLIDYTTNPLVSLWFATESKKVSEKDILGCVYCVENSTSINKLIQAENSLSLKTIFENTDAIYVFNPPSLNRRIISQQSVLLVNAQGCVDKSKHLQIIIPFESKEDIRSQLALVGISRKTLFPDFHGFIEWFSYDTNTIIDELTLMMSSGWRHLKKNELVLAEKMYNETHDLYQTHVSKLEDKGLLADIYTGLAEVHDRKPDYEKALEWYQKVLEIREDELGKEHPNTATSYDNIAMVYYDQGKYKKALELYRKALVIYEKVFGEEHPTTAGTYNNIAMVYDEQGDYEKALELYQKAVDIYEKTLGKEHPTTANSYNNIAIEYGNLGDYDKALELYQKALDIYEKAFGKEHPTTANSYNNIAGVYDDLGDHEKALELYQKALDIREKALSKEHPTTADSYNNIAIEYGNLGDYDKALELYQKALDIYEKALGKEHPKTVSVRENIELLKRDQADK